MIVLFLILIVGFGALAYIGAVGDRQIKEHYDKLDEEQRNRNSNKRRY